MVQLKVTEEERLAILDRLTAGDPVLWGRLVILEHRQELEEESDGTRAKSRVCG